MDERYAINYLSEEVPDVETVVETCLDVGLWTTPDGETDRVANYYVAHEDSGRTTHEDVDLAEAIEDVASAPAGGIRFWYERAELFSLMVHFRNDADADWRIEKLGLGFQTIPVDPMFDSDDFSPTRDEAQSRVETILELAIALVAVLEPDYAWGEMATLFDGVSPQRPAERPMSEAIEELGWITVLSPELVEAFGGREYVLDAPAWRIEELDTGHVVLLIKDHPFRATEGTVRETIDYVLAGRDGS